MLDNGYMHNPHLTGDPFLWEDGPVGVLLMHGYTATTAEVRPLARLLHQQGYTVSGPLLPGHGTTPDDLNRCRWQDWATGAVEAYQQLADRCELVFVGGESMGALLALYLASQYAKVAGILAYAPALRVSPLIALRARLTAPFVPIVPKRNLKSANWRWQGYAVHPLRALVQLLRFQRQMRRHLSRLRQPLLIIQGRLDTAIDLRGVDLLYRKIGSPLKELHWLEQSGHVVILDDELEQVTALTGHFMERVLDGTVGTRRQ